ncbi:transcriptional regulator [Streptomyces sp. NPDC052693]|uniref:ArsR/SmtB family transcription factor n=1 Tax=Streptomyces sp. NPDC052693 TaxID=3155814 RepID=UPI003413E54E
MLRVHFTSEDIARVRVAAAPDPLWEITNSFQVLVRNENGLSFGQWRRQVKSRLPPPVRTLAALLPPRGYSPDFLTPDLEGSFDLESAVDMVLSTPRNALRSDLSRLAVSQNRSGRLPTVIDALARGDPESLRRLGAIMHMYHQNALAPFWPRIRAQVDADLAGRARAVLAGGTESLLAGFRPVLRWEPPVLEADYPVDRDLHLDGRGLLLQPSYFCVGRPVMLATPKLPPVLVYPVQHTLGWARAGGPADRGTELGALIGRTRAAILEDVVSGRTTSELAARRGISGAAASQHTAVLRRAGLLLSTRHSKHILHTITPTGLALLNSPLSAPIDV